MGAALPLQIPGADNPCRTCHPREVAGYEQTAMAHSFSHLVHPKSGTVTHPVSNTTFVIGPQRDPDRVTISRDGASASHTLAYTIGSGTHAFGYLIESSSHLFQAPVSYYTKREMWDMAPGYESNTGPDFFRPVSAECLRCHTGRVQPLPGTLNHYGAIDAADEPISCDRCHGDPSVHMRKPDRTTIVNPARLAGRARDSVCEQCHLSGEVRILNPGKQFADFRPGDNLEDVFSIYVRDHPAQSPQASIKVISHAEQLALSTCALKSEGRLWCGTCHDPHEQPANPVSYFRARCLSCHGESLLSTHAKPADNCIGCHMPKRPAQDGAHTVFTDHRITRFPQKLAPAPMETSLKLRSWHEAPGGALSNRNLGLANIAIGERERSSDLLDEGVRQLIAAMKELPPDPVVLTNLGVTLLRKGDASDAVEVLEYALKLEPNSAGRHANLGLAYSEAGRSDQAIEELNKAIELDPASESAYQKLAEIYLSQNDPAAVRRTFEQYLKAMPGNLTAIKALRQLDVKLPPR